jgi:sugar phosphate isomerase/epimerase
VIGQAQLGLAPLGFLELDPPALLEVAAAAGFAWVTVRTRAAVPSGREYPLAAGSRLSRETESRIRATGVGLLQIEIVPLALDTDVGACRSMLEGGAALGARRVVATGDDPDDLVVATRLASLCDLAAEYGMSVDLEFMPFRQVATLPQALAIVARADSDNVRVMIDALHLFRSGGSVADVAAAPASRVGVCQLCDAPLVAPAPEQLAAEAREARLSPGEGDLPLRALLAALPDGSPLAAEVPFAQRRPDLTVLERARLVYRATSALLV